LGQNGDKKSELSTMKADDVNKTEEEQVERKGRIFTESGSASHECETLNPLNAGLLRFFSLDALIDLFAMHRHFFRRVNTDTNLVTLNTQHRYSYLITDHEGFTNSTS